MIKNLTIVIWVLCCAAPALAQGSWSEIPCGDSFLELEPAIKCHRHSDSRSAGDDIEAVGAAFGVRGTAGGVLLSAVLTWPVGDGTYIKAYTSDNALQAIKSQNALTSESATNWSELRGFANVSYMSFQAMGHGCVGFDDAGPLFEYGYAWRLVGSACAMTVDNPEALVKAVLGALRIGPPGSSKNASGEQIQPLSWPR